MGSEMCIRDSAGTGFTKNKLNKVAQEQDKIRLEQLEKKELEIKQEETKT